MEAKNWKHPTEIRVATLTGRIVNLEVEADGDLPEDLEETKFPQG
jgi:hypothetical protein